MNARSVIIKTVAQRIAVAAWLVMASWLTPAVAMTVNILPVQVCDDSGNNCANSGKELYLAQTNKIWAQAGITMNFLPWTSIDNTSAQNFTSITDENTFFNDTANNGISGTATTITMWFVQSLTGSDYGTVDVIGGRKVMIPDNVFSTTRLDTIAHELGHTLGLTHSDPGMDDTFLMTSGLTRTIPGAIGDITPDGAKLDKLTAAQITTAKASAYVVPLPGAIYLLISGMGMLLGVRIKTPYV